MIFSSSKKNNNETFLIKAVFLKFKISFVLIILFSLTFISRMTAQNNYFYTGKNYGSEALFNPVSLLINGGYDITQLQSVSDKIGDHDYGAQFRTVMRSLGSPIESIRKYGWWKLVRTELLPLRWDKGYMQWIPNYQQHLIGGGMLFTATKEWYEYHGFPAPWLLSFATVMSQHVLNEMLETGKSEPISVDEVVDIYLFDLGGILLFSFDSVNEFFHDELNLADWSLQAGVSAPNGRVNAGQYFSIKWALPFWKDYSFFYRYGMGALFGLSKKINAEDNLSFGIGFRTKHLIDLEVKVRRRTIETGFHAGVFYDRNNSLLASVVFSGIKEYFCMIDVYPGVIKIGNFSPGFWSVIGLNRGATFGFSTRWVFSFGYESEY